MLKFFRNRWLSRNDMIWILKNLANKISKVDILPKLF